MGPPRIQLDLSRKDAHNLCFVLNEYEIAFKKSNINIEVNNYGKSLRTVLNKLKRQGIR